MFSRLRLRTKLALLLAMSALAVVASIAQGAIMLHQRMTDDRVEKLRAVVQSTVGIARMLEAQVEARTITHDQAVVRLRETVHPMRFDGGAGYVSVSGDDGLVIVQSADPSREGKPSTAVDRNGRPLSALYAEALRNSDEGVVSYTFPRPGQKEPLPKIAYVAHFAPWHAVVLSGAYTDDLDADFMRTFTHLSIVGGLILLLTLPLAWLVNRDIRSMLGGLRDVMTRLAGGDLSVVIPNADRKDELGGMAQTLAVFKQNAGQIAALQREQLAERERGDDTRRQRCCNWRIGSINRCGAWWRRSPLPAAR